MSCHTPPMPCPLASAVPVATGKVSTTSPSYHLPRPGNHPPLLTLAATQCPCFNRPLHCPGEPPSTSACHSRHFNSTPTRQFSVKKMVCLSISQILMSFAFRVLCVFKLSSCHVDHVDNNAYGLTVVFSAQGGAIKIYYNEDKFVIVHLEPGMILAG